MLPHRKIIEIFTHLLNTLDTYCFKPIIKYEELEELDNYKVIETKYYPEYIRYANDNRNFKRIAYLITPTGTYRIHDILLHILNDNFVKFENSKIYIECDSFVDLFFDLTSELDDKSILDIIRTFGYIKGIKFNHGIGLGIKESEHYKDVDVAIYRMYPSIKIEFQKEKSNDEMEIKLLVNFIINVLHTYTNLNHITRGEV